MKTQPEGFVSDYCNDLLRIGETDLRAAVVLHKAQCYPQAYFSFQQAVEKTAKAFGLTLNIITVDELLHVGHDHFKIYRKVIKQSEEKIEAHLKTIEPCQEAKNHSIHQDLHMEKIPERADKARRFFDSLKNTDLVNIDEETVDYFISEISNLENHERHLDILKHEAELKNRMMQVADWIGSFGTPHALAAKQELILFFNDKSKRDEYYKMVSDYIWLIVDFAYIQVTLYFFALLTIQHSSQTRYISEDGTNPLELYTEELPVINRLPRMCELLSIVIERFKKINALKASNEIRSR
jgi:HEPN domain-containing protein